MQINPNKEPSNPLLQRSLLVGSFAHSCEVLTFGHLLDRLKVEQEIHPDLKVKNALMAVWKKGRWEALYRGFKWNIALSAFKGGFGWSIHNFSNSSMMIFYPQKDPKKPSFFFTTSVGVCTALLETSFILSPLERLKTVDMTTGNKKISSTKDIIINQGARFFFQGWSLICLRQSCSWIVYLNIYQQLRQKLQIYNAYQPSSLKQKIVLGGCTGGLAAIINAPLDLLKTRVQKAGTAESKNILISSQVIVKKYGIKGLYNGLTMKMVRQTWSCAVVLTILDRLEALPINMRV